MTSRLRSSSFSLTSCSHASVTRTPIEGVTEVYHHLPPSLYPVGDLPVPSSSHLPVVNSFFQCPHPNNHPSLSTSMVSFLTQPPWSRDTHTHTPPPLTRPPSHSYSHTVVHPTLLLSVQHLYKPSVLLPFPPRGLKAVTSLHPLFGRRSFFPILPLPWVDGVEVLRTGKRGRTFVGTIPSLFPTPPEPSTRPTRRSRRTVTTSVPCISWGVSGDRYRSRNPSP